MIKMFSKELLKLSLFILSIIVLSVLPAYAEAAD
jgi:hypothetical protein